MPAKSSQYWLGTHTYTSTLKMQRSATYDTRTSLQYYYQNEVMPTTMPVAQVPRGEVFRVQAHANDRRVPVPPQGPFKPAGRRSTGDATFSIGGALAIGLDQRSVSAQFPVLPEDWSAVQEIMRGNAGSVRGSARKYKSVQVVLDKLELSDEGRNGGYFYQVYLNVPSPDGTPTSVLLGTLGAFQINGVLHHGGPARLRYTIARGLVRNQDLRVGIASISFVRVDGDNSPRGATVGIGEARLELSTEEKDS
jgi:tyrosinase